jgi:hypothetical protein
MPKKPLKKHEKIDVDYTVTREIYFFPGTAPGDLITGPAQLIYKHSKEVKGGGSEEYNSLPRHVIRGERVSVNTITGVVGNSMLKMSTTYKSVEAVILGEPRKYLAEKRAIGHVTPLTTDTLSDVVGLLQPFRKGVTNRRGAIGDVVGGLGSGVIGKGIDTLILLPNHDVGVIQVKSNIFGITVEGGSDMDTTGYLASTDMSFDERIYTEAMSDYIRGRRFWNKFLTYPSNIRNKAIKIVNNGFDTTPESQQIMASPEALMYPYWALERGLNQFLPPTDVRTLPYPGYKKQRLESKAINSFKSAIENAMGKFFLGVNL